MRHSAERTTSGRAGSSSRVAIASMSAQHDERDDEALLEAFAREGDRTALDLLFRRTLPAAYRLAARMTRNEADAEDVVQAAFGRVLAKAHQFSRRASARAWIFAIVANAARKRLRDERRRRRYESAAVHAVGSQPVTVDDETRASLLNALDRLPEHERLPLWLRYVEGLSLREVAAALGAPLGTVQAQVHRGLERLRERVAGGGAAGVVVAMLAGAPRGQPPPALAAQVARVARHARAMPSVAAASIIAIACGAGAIAIAIGLMASRTRPSTVAVPGGHAWHVAADGRSDGDGSEAHPLDLATAIGEGGPARPGDTIWVHGGSYRGRFTGALSGTPEAPIVIRASPGERPVIDAAGPGQTAALSISGAWTWWWGLGITDSSTRPRISSSNAQEPPDLDRHGGIVTGNAEGQGVGVKLIDLELHDLLFGISVSSAAIGSELSGNIVHDVGWRGPGAVHGSAIAVQNAIGERSIHGNVWFDVEGSGLLAFGERASIDGLAIVDNVAWGCGDAPLRVGGAQPAHRVSVRANRFLSTGASSDAIRIGWRYGRGDHDIAIDGNLLLGGLDIGGAWDELAFHRNTVMAIGDALVYARAVGPAWRWNGNHYLGREASPFRRGEAEIGADLAAWRLATGFDRDSDIRDQAADPVQIAVTPDPYDPARSRLTVIAWDGRTHADVELARIVPRDRSCVVRSVADGGGTPISTGPGAAVVLPLQEPRRATAPTAAAGPRWGVFIVTIE